MIMITQQPEEACPTMASVSNADPTKAGVLAQQIVAILIDEDSATRQRAVQAAMMLMGESCHPQINVPTRTPIGEPSDGNHTELATFFNRDEDLKPSDNAFLCAAFQFAQFGPIPFSLAEIRSIATDAGVTIPDRLDKTFAVAKKKGKKLFREAGKGAFKPTAAGSLMFKEKWGVRPGRRTTPNPSSISVGATNAKAR